MIEKEYSLKNYNTFGLNVKAKYFFSFESLNELYSFSKENIKENENIFILGGGSNVLFTKDYEGWVIHSLMKEIRIVEESNDNVILEVDGGLTWDDFVEFCVKNNYYGIENLSLIPGNVGTTPVQNIGAYGVEIKDFIVEVKAYDIIKRKEIILSNEDCNFGYRYSIFKTEKYRNVIITSVVYKLSKIPYYKIKLREHKGGVFAKYLEFLIELLKNLKDVFFKAKINLKKRSISIDYRVLKGVFESSGIFSLRKIRNMIIKKRNAKIPNPKKVGNVGSFFKNPIIDNQKVNELKNKFSNVVTYNIDDKYSKISAGWLIKECGWQGKRINDVGLYKDQTLIIANFGNSTGEEIHEFSEKIVESVYEKFSIRLEREVVVI
ncbi:FAD-binding protein [Aquimarina rhabdastrellae]